MIATARAGLAAAFVFACLLAVPAAALAQKAYQRSDLADAAIRLECQIRSEAGQASRPLAQLRRDADAALKRGDPRGALVLLGQIVAAAPGEAAHWLRLAQTARQVRPNDARERTQLLERAGTAAYAAYERAANRGEEAAALALVGQSFADRRIWRPALDALRLSLDLREAPDIRALYARLREDHGFRLLENTVDADAASPRACFQFSEPLPGGRTDLSPFVAVAGIEKPAISADDRQLCIEGLRHGERYDVTLRAGLPSTVNETLLRSAAVAVYVRDRKPAARFASRAYVLPRAGQRGIPVVSVNTRAVDVQIFRVSDRNLVDIVTGGDFQRGLGRYELEHFAQTRGIAVWKGELAVEQQALNAEATTAFPIGEAVPDLAPGVYVMTAAPAGAEPDDMALATQWFVVSDLGLSAYSGSDGIHVSVRSLAGTQARAGVEVRLLSLANEVLSTKRTDAEGRVHFEPGLARGERSLSPALLVAVDGKGDYAFLSLKGPAFDLTDRGVAGRAAPSGLDAFVVAERGVYRSGETVHVTALLRDAQGAAAANVPLTLVFERPDGLEHRRTVVPDQGLGGRSLSLPLGPSAATGTWRVRAYADPKRPPVGETAFLVEDYMPDRLEFELKSAATVLSRTAPAEIAVEGRYLYGAAAAGLSLEGELAVAPAAERPGFPGYRFGLADDEVNGGREPIEDMPETDATGRAAFKVDPARLPASSRPLEAQIVVRMAEPGGRAVERKLSLPVAPAADMIGVRPLFAGRSLGEGESAGFDVILVTPEGKPLARQGLRYELLKIEQRYQYYRRGSIWSYEPIKMTRRVADGRIDLSAGAPARLSLPVQWGRYRLEVSTGEPDGPATSVPFDAGWYAEASAETPDMLEIALDKPEYRPGEAINVAVTARTAGTVTLDVIGDRLLSSTTHEVQPGTANLRVEVGRDWGAGAYVVATLRRPLDASAQRMPGRAMGLRWFAVDRQARTLALDVALPQLQRPNTPMTLPIRLGGLAPGEEARVVVAAVDVGILNLTNHKPPAPDEHYLGQRRLGAEIRDLYGELIDGMQGARGRIRSGGDGPAMELSGSPPAQAPLALYSGIVTVRPDGTAEVTFDIPAFAGTARVMAVAWSRDKVGQFSGDVTIRDPLVLTTTLPRFLLTGDRSTAHLDLDNIEGPAGEYRVSVRGEGAVALGGAAEQSVRLGAKERRQLSLPLSASGSGASAVSVRIAGPEGFALERRYALNVNPATQTLTRRTVRPLAQGESLSLSEDLFADLVPGTGSVALSVGASTALDAATLLRALDRYPFGCSEQIASRALPLLYVNELAAGAQLALDGAIDQRIRDAIDRLLARQSANGSFGLWGVGGDDAWLDAYVTDFLSRARERGFAVPDTAFRLALDRLRNIANNAPEPAKDGGRNLAYALYVLARNGQAPLGDLRYLADARLGDLATPIARAQVAAALGMLGDRTRAERIYADALGMIRPPQGPELASRIDYGSALRDAAALVTLASEGNGPRPTITTAVQRIEQTRALATHTSTQEQAWLVLAARALARDAAAVSLDVDGEPRKGAFLRTVRTGELGRPLQVRNAGDGPLQAVVSVSGAPTVPEPAAERGFKIVRSFHTLDGAPADPSRATQNQRFVVVLTVTEPQPQFGRLIVADYLPAGFEIDNPRLVSSGETGTLDWIANAAEPAHAEFRDDRFAAAFERKAGDKPTFAAAYVVRAVSPGRYVLPQAYVEDMYRPERFGRTATGTVEVAAK